MTRTSTRIAQRAQMPPTNATENQDTGTPNLRDQRKRRRTVVAESEKRAAVVKTERKPATVDPHQPPRRRGRPPKHPKPSIDEKQETACPSTSISSPAPPAPPPTVPPSNPTTVTYYSYVNYVPNPTEPKTSTASETPFTRHEPAPPAHASSTPTAHEISEFDTFIASKNVHTQDLPIKQDVDGSMPPDAQHHQTVDEVELVAVKPEPTAGPSLTNVKTPPKRKAAQRDTPRPASVGNDICVVWVTATHNVFSIYEESGSGKGTIGVFENDRDADYGYFLAVIHILQEINPSTTVLVQSQCRQLMLSHIPYPHVHDMITRLTSDREGRVHFQYVPKRERTRASIEAENMALMAQSTLHSILDAIEESSSMEDQEKDEILLMTDAIERTLEDLKQLQQTSSVIPATVSIICASEPKESSVEPSEKPVSEDSEAQKAKKVESEKANPSKSFDPEPEPELEPEREPEREHHAILAEDIGVADRPPVQLQQQQQQQQQESYHSCPTCGNSASGSNSSVRATPTTDEQLLQQVEQLQRDMALLMDIVRKEHTNVSSRTHSTDENADTSATSVEQQVPEESRQPNEAPQAEQLPASTDNKQRKDGALGRAWSLFRSPFSYIGP